MLKNMIIQCIAIDWQGDLQVQEDAPRNRLSLPTSDPHRNARSVAHLRNRLVIKARKPASLQYSTVFSQAPP